VAVREDLRRHALRIDPTARIEIIPSGVDAARYASPDGAGREPGRILLVGRLIPLKGQVVFLRALARVRERHRGPLSAEIVGVGPDLEHLRSEAARLGLSQVLSIPGFVSDEALAVQYARASLFVSLPNDAGPRPARSDGRGLPVVASAGGIPEVGGGPRSSFRAGTSRPRRRDPRRASDPARAAAMARSSRASALAFD
jgi:glycosyltransferase involved in cell wall biosynthesis